MSIHLINEVYRHRSVEGRLQRVLVCLCDSANDDGVCWPSVDYIAWKLECSVRTVQRAIADLESLGVVKVEPRYMQSNVYVIDLTRLPEKKPFRSKGSGRQNDGVEESQGDNLSEQGDNLSEQGDNLSSVGRQNDTHNRQGNRQKESSVNRENHVAGAPNNSPYTQSESQPRAEASSIGFVTNASSGGDRSWRRKVAAPDIEQPVLIPGETEPSQTKSENEKPKRTRRSGVSENFWPDDKLREWARKSGYRLRDVEQQVPKFVDYHAGKGTLMKDWNAAFRNWIRNAEGYGHIKKHASVEREVPKSKRIDEAEVERRRSEAFERMHEQQRREYEERMRASD